MPSQFSHKNFNVTNFSYYYIKKSINKSSLSLNDSAIGVQKVFSHLNVKVAAMSLKLEIRLHAYRVDRTHNLIPK